MFSYAGCFKGLQLATVLYALGIIGVAVGYSGGKGTPRNMEQILIGRCEEFQNVIRPDLFTDGQKNCTELWVKFRQAFAHKSPCNVSVDSYNEFVEAAYHRVDTQDKVMYWSGSVYPMVIDYARQRSNYYITIREILAAYVIRNIEDWCGQQDGFGINHNQCPSWGTCPLLATTSFWTALSKNFAKQVKGTVHVMLSGSSGHAYLNTSIFAHSELKNLEASRTPKMHVHLAYDLNLPIKEKCGQGTLVTMQKDVEKKGMEFICTDDDLDLLYFQCVSDMQAKRCKEIAVGGSTGAVSSARSLSCAPGLPMLMVVLMLLMSRNGYI